MVVFIRDIIAAGRFGQICIGIPDAVFHVPVDRACSCCIAGMGNSVMYRQNSQEMQWQVVRMGQVCAGNRDPVLLHELCVSFRDDDGDVGRARIIQFVYNGQ